MTPEEKRHTAQAILAIPMFGQLIDDLEADEINAAVNANYDDHEKHQAHLAAVRAIRNLRTRIAALAESQASVGRKAPA